MFGVKEFNSSEVTNPYKENGLLKSIMANRSYEILYLPLLVLSSIDVLRILNLEVHFVTVF